MNENIKAGNLLIADPFLKDPNFQRTVVLLCDHHEETGTIGFVINRKYHKTVGELISQLEGCEFPVYYGGPVQTDTVHFLHRCPNLITDGLSIGHDIYWGGDFETAAELVKNNQIQQSDIRFYIGYSGWGEGQLASEMEEKTWLTTEANTPLVFHPNVSLIWQDSIRQLGGKYEQLIHYPLDPQLN
ncbi:MAG: YqgE/AlgH family protein [Williamsia sp.]|nr:YqgE/AlgH family protein [Williamsia sp.]